MTAQSDAEPTVTASRMQIASGGTDADARTEIAALYASHALEIADALGEQPLCVVTGPRRFGKTTSLLPALAGVLRERGKTARIMNGRDFEGEPFTADALPREQFDALIIDEANVLTSTKRRTKELLQLLHARAAIVVAMITFHAGYELGARYLARTWQDAERAISGRKVHVVCLPQMIVAPHLARELLSTYSPIRDPSARSRVIDYITDRVPLNPHVVLELARARSITEANAIIRQRKSTLFQGALSPDEYTKLEQSLEE